MTLHKDILTHWWSTNSERDVMSKRGKRKISKKILWTLVDKVNKEYRYFVQKVDSKQSEKKRGNEEHKMVWEVRVRNMTAKISFLLVSKNDTTFREMACVLEKMPIIVSRCFCVWGRLLTSLRSL